MKKFFPKYQRQFEELLIKSKSSMLAIIGHFSPDGDCISSTFALADILEDIGAQEVVCLNKDKLPRLYENFAYGRKLKDSETFKDREFEIITVDCANYGRSSLNISRRYKRAFACIDHHVGNNTPSQISIIEPTASATAELIAGLAFDAGLHISKENANRLYMGIMTDTRQLTTSSVNLKTFEISARLVEAGADPMYVAGQLYQRESFGKMKLLAQYLNSINLSRQGRVCIGILPKGVYEATNSTRADADGLVDFARSVDGVEIAVIIEPREDSIKGSIRSSDPKFKVNELAGHFGGGGHHAAAGFLVNEENFDKFYQDFETKLDEHLKRFD